MLLLFSLEHKCSYTIPVKKVVCCETQLILFFFLKAGRRKWVENSYKVKKSCLNLGPVDSNEVLKFLAKALKLLECLFGKCQYPGTGDLLL